MASISVHVKRDRDFPIKNFATAKYAKYAKVKLEAGKCPSEMGVFSRISQIFSSKICASSQMQLLGVLINIHMAALCRGAATD
jgi:hypothetical protein